VTFSSSLAAEILDYWNDEDVALSVHEVSSSYVQEELELAWGQWEVGFLSFGIFILCVVLVVLLVARIREYYKMKFKRELERESKEGLLTDNGTYQQEKMDRKISLEKFPSADSLHESVISRSETPHDAEYNTDDIEAKGEAEDVFVPRKSSAGIFATRPTHVRALTFDDTMRSTTYNIHDEHPPTTRMSVANHLRSKSSADAGMRKSTFVREAHRQRRKTVLKNMKARNSPRKTVKHVVADQDGDVRVQVTTRMSEFSVDGGFVFNPSPRSVSASGPAASPVSSPRQEPQIVPLKDDNS